MRLRLFRSIVRGYLVACLGLLVSLCQPALIHAREGSASGGQDCTPIEPEELRELVFTGLHKLLDAELEEARILLSHATRQQACLTAVVAPQLLGHAWLGLAGVRLQQGDEEGARAAVSQALVLNPDALWSFQQGTRGAEVLTQERARMQAQARVRWRLPLLKRGQEVYMDGLRWKNPGRAQSWQPGRHLLQVLEGGHIVYGGWMALGER